MSKHTYLVKALRAYRATTYGQFDQETHYTVQETQDAANAIEQLEKDCGKARDMLAKLLRHPVGISTNASEVEEARALLATLPQ